VQHGVSLIHFECSSMFSAPGFLLTDCISAADPGFLWTGMQYMMDLEICVDSVESAVAAEAGGAQRVELCSALAEGGLTPSLGLIRAVRASVTIGVHVMIRPRGGDFFYSQDEWAVMRDDIVCAAEAGVNGVVLGVLTADGDVNVEQTRALVEAAHSMEVTFHRAIDMTRDLESSLEAIAGTGVTRILTSGAAQNAILGSKRVAGLVQAAGNRIGVMVCGNVRSENLRQIALTTGAREFHAALRTAVASPVIYRNPNLHLGDVGSDEYLRHVVVEQDVRQLRRAMDAVSSVASATQAR
jgi:copper homeostasis protein